MLFDGTVWVNRLLPREEVALAVDASACPDCGAALHSIGVTTSELLDWVPASLRVIRIYRPKYGCRACGTIHQAAAPERLIAKGISLNDVQADHAYGIPIFEKRRSLAWLTGLGRACAAARTLIAVSRIGIKPTVDVID